MFFETVKRNKVLVSLSHMKRVLNTQIVKRYKPFLWVGPHLQRACKTLAGRAKITKQLKRWQKTAEKTRKQKGQKQEEQLN